MAFGLMLIGQSDAGLVGAWLFDENSGDAAGDFSGNGNDGMLMNGAGWTAGVRGSAVSFVGGGDPQFILFNADEDPAGAFILHSDSDVSMVLWVRPTEVVTAHGCGLEAMTRMPVDLTSTTDQATYSISTTGKTRTRVLIRRTAGQQESQLP